MGVGCEKCGSSDLTKSRKGLGTVCKACGNYKHYGNAEIVANIVNKECTAKEKLIQYITKNSEYLFECGHVGDYIRVDTLLKGIEELL